MDSFAWMAWTWPTAAFFVALGCTLAVMTWLAAAYPETERVGVLHIPTTRGDRLFISLVLAAVIHLVCIGVVGTEPLFSVPVGDESFDVSRLWLASGISLVMAVAVFRKV
ncbi:DUF2160 domain-containing protein [Rhodopseudomonas sp.]|uniref:DUF2160 domain-containing protein n=1 Tax=Rhodopseudomonas sp. TaxID=1078 RepID=UPI003B3A1BF2